MAVGELQGAGYVVVVVTLIDDAEVCKAVGGWCRRDSFVVGAGKEGKGCECQKDGTGEEGWKFGHC